MKKSMSMDLTALLDVILIILFAVMLNVSQTSKNTILDQEALIGTIAEYEALLTQLEIANQELTQSLEKSIEAHNTIELNYKELVETQALYNLQQTIILENLMDLREISPEQQQTIIEAQTNSELMANLIETLTITDNNSSTLELIENLHKYTVIANKFLFLDAAINVDTGEFIFDNQPSGIIIEEDDGFDNHLFQIKKAQLVDYMIQSIKENDRTYSFILITTSYDPYITKRYYLNLVTEAIDQLRANNDAYIIFDTEYLD